MRTATAREWRVRKPSRLPYITWTQFSASCPRCHRVRLAAAWAAWCGWLCRMRVHACRRTLRLLIGRVPADIGGGDERRHPLVA